MVYRSSEKNVISIYVKELMKVKFAIPLIVKFYLLT